MRLVTQMTTVYYDMDNFGYSSKIHKQLTREFAKFYIIEQKFVGDKRQLGVLKDEVDPRFVSVLCEKQEGHKDSTDFRITIEIMDDLKKKGRNFFVVASHDKDFIQIAKKVHESKKKFGVLVRNQAVSPTLREHCDFILSLKDGEIHVEEIKKGQTVGLYAQESAEKEVGVQTDPIVTSRLEQMQANLILGWIDYNCKGYKGIAVEIDRLMKQMEQNQKDISPPVTYQALHRDMSNQLFWPHKFRCGCAALADPFAKGPEACPIFHLYLGGRLEQEVVGANLKELRRAIKMVYKIIV
jgi:uncharacterized LabA/DUF88 family protein